MLGVWIRVGGHHVGEPLLPLHPPAGHGRHPGVKGAPPVTGVRIHLVQVVTIQYILFTFGNIGCVIFSSVMSPSSVSLTWHHGVISKRLFNSGHCEGGSTHGLFILIQIKEL